MPDFSVGKLYQTALLQAYQTGGQIPVVGPSVKKYVVGLQAFNTLDQQAEEAQFKVIGEATGTDPALVKDYFKRVGTFAVGVGKTPAILIEELLTSKLGSGDELREDLAVTRSRMEAAAAARANNLGNKPAVKSAGGGGGNQPLPAPYVMPVWLADP